MLGLRNQILKASRLIQLFLNCIIGTIPVVRQRKNWVSGWIWKMAIFAVVQYCIYMLKELVGG